ncbi:MAG: hypothetical protein AAFN79_19510 [Pseudomonadota bacterium]
MFDLDALSDLNKRLEAVTCEAHRASVLANEAMVLSAVARERARLASRKATAAVVSLSGCPHLNGHRDG